MKSAKREVTSGIRVDVCLVQDTSESAGISCRRERHPDKQYSLVDCISMNVMRRRQDEAYRADSRCRAGRFRPQMLRGMEPGWSQTLNKLGEFVPAR